MTTDLESGRRIGPWGTVARVVVGAAMVAGAALIGIGALEAAIGLIAFPAFTVAVLALRGRDAPPLSLTSSEWCCLAVVPGAAAFIFLPVASLLFFGASMLLAAARGYGGCEVFAVSNWLRRRDDQIACPLFTPVDSAERRARTAL
jgi:hypothetical protein